MTSDHFFIDKKKLESRYAYLEGEEHHHLSRVARIKPKDKVWLFDEQGMTYLARVEEIERDKTWLVIIKKKKAEEAKIKITLAQSLLRSKKMEFIIQKATEWGITTFIPLLTEVSKRLKTRISSSVIVFVGPEGGWSEEEEREILGSDFEAISLGNQVLRAETAALFSIALIAHFWNL